jgi:hypothetical protein
MLGLSAGSAILAVSTASVSSIGDLSVWDRTPFRIAPHAIASFRSELSGRDGGSLMGWP